jgi:hypothetical protein
LASKLTRCKAAVPPGSCADGLDGEPIDHAYLGRFTQGNADLEREVLELFAGMIPRYLDDLRAAATRPRRSRPHHQGLAAAVGAAGRRALPRWPRGST